MTNLPPPGLPPAPPNCPPFSWRPDSQWVIDRRGCYVCDMFYSETVTCHETWAESVAPVWDIHRVMVILLNLLLGAVLVYQFVRLRRVTPKWRPLTPQVRVHISGFFFFLLLWEHIVDPNNFGGMTPPVANKITYNMAAACVMFNG